MICMDDIHGWCAWVIYMDEIHGWYTWMISMHDIHGARPGHARPDQTRPDQTQKYIIFPLFWHEWASYRRYEGLDRCKMKYFFNFMPSRGVPGPIYRVKRWFIGVQRSNIKIFQKSIFYIFSKSLRGPPAPPPDPRGSKNRFLGAPDRFFLYF